MEGGDEGVEVAVDSKDMQQQSKAFDKLTDRVEDRQLDSTRVQEAMASIYASKEADIQAARLRFLMSFPFSFFLLYWILLSGWEKHIVVEIVALFGQLEIES
ncbi:uncharacterized protein [Primulina huaijiensis]|uniref:uncharacterized protein isoform X2 n=1 Tax=Primulina huaijiensis TaxID=1492673 RepID=UPI003CC766EC